MQKKISIVTYATKSYDDVLSFTLDSWKRSVPTADISVLSDTEGYHTKAFEPSDDRREHYRRRIECVRAIVKRLIEDGREGDGVIYLDSDVYAEKDPSIVFYSHSHDLIVTRMIRRKDRSKKEINDGVIFFRANHRVLAMLDLWSEKELELAKQGVEFPAQKSLDRIATLAFDGLLPITASTCSENLFNFEREDIKDFKSGLMLYEPYLVHFKHQIRAYKDWKDMVR